MRRLLRSKYVLLAFAFAWGSLLPSTGWASASFALELADEGVPLKQKSIVKTFLAQAEELLPPELKRRLDRKIHVKFVSDLGPPTGGRFLVPVCPAESADSAAGAEREWEIRQIRGAVVSNWRNPENRIREIRLNEALLSEIVKGPELATRYPCGHRNLYRLALATLLHEISHIYDFSPYKTEERKAQLSRCEGLTAHHENSNHPEFELCLSELKTSRVVSHTPTFLSLMNWEDFKQRNLSLRRSQDPYEMKEVEESFAVNMAYFLLDPEYACRRPTEFEYLKDHFTFDPFPGRDCKLNTNVEFTASVIGGEKGATLDLNPARVYQVHYLFASRGPQLMSKFGHAMFRIVLCAPSRTVVGPECLNDISHHVVVSFRANPDDWEISLWRGINGGYSSQMFLYPFYPRIVNEYTSDEPRDLISLPLAFDERLKNRFVEKIIETYWAYRGRYFYFSNNCASEALFLLKSVIRDPRFQAAHTITPSGLYALLQDQGWIERVSVEKSEDRERAMERGVLFPSNHQLFETSFSELKKLEPRLFPFKDVDAYRKGTSARERLRSYLSLRELPGGAPKGLAQRYFILESYFFRLARKAFMGRVQRTLDSEKMGSSEMRAKVQRINEIQKQSLAANSIGGYGVPLEGELHEAQERFEGAAMGEEEARLLDEVLRWARLELRSFSRELSDMEQNRSFFLKQMKRGARR